MSQASIDESIRRMSIQDHGTGSVYEDERNANSYNGSRANSVQHQDPYREPPRNAYARSNVRIFHNFFLSVGLFMLILSPIMLQGSDHC